MYEERLVAYLDILGFSEIIQLSVGDDTESLAIQRKIYDAIDEIRTFFLQPTPDRYIDLQVTQASDSLIFSRKLDETGGVLSMINACSFACHVLLNKGFFFRGAITMGYLYHKDDILFGPAVIEAYKLETREKFPVVKFSRDVLEVARQFPTEAQKGYEDVEIKYIMDHASVLSPNYLFVDYFKDYGSLVGAGNRGTINHYNGLKTLIENNLRNANTLSVMEKMEWARERFNQNVYVIGAATEEISYRIPFFRKMKAYPCGLVHRVRKACF